MANPTIVYFERCTKKYGGTTYVFRILDRKRTAILVSSFENGIATIRPMSCMSITQMAEIVEGCFERYSNFAIELSRVFDFNKNIVLKGIKFELNQITVTISKENANQDKIFAEWQASMEEKMLKIATSEDLGQEKADIVG